MKFAAVIEYAKTDRIAEVRPEHRAYLRRLRDQGKLAAAGPFSDDSGALIIYEANSQDEVEDLIAGDPFSRSGVFKSCAVRPWDQVF